MGRAARCAIENEAQIAVKHFRDILDSRHREPETRLRDPLNYARFFVGELLPAADEGASTWIRTFRRALYRLLTAARRLFADRQTRGHRGRAEGL